LPTVNSHLADDRREGGGRKDSGRSESLPTDKQSVALVPHPTIFFFMPELTDSQESSSGCCDWRKNVHNFTESTEKFVHEDPAKAIGLALFGGVLLTILPVGRLISALVRLAFALARPLLLVLGAVKIYEEFQKSQKP
jgi:hypothetical protein